MEDLADHSPDYSGLFQPCSYWLDFVIVIIDKLPQVTEYLNMYQLLPIGRRAACQTFNIMYGSHILQLLCVQSYTHLGLLMLQTQVGHLHPTLAVLWKYPLF